MRTPHIRGYGRTPRSNPAEEASLAHAWGGGGNSQASLESRLDPTLDASQGQSNNVDVLDRGCDIRKILETEFSTLAAGP
ncbi:hypothetical protein G7046_g557 [Stylonectria norvegica]|nr:hypothetical protein G7046_g557 [Stylonectria norvegica]